MKTNIDKYRHATGMMCAVVLMASAMKAHAIVFPGKADMAMEITYRPPAKGGPCLVHMPGYEAMRMVIISGNIVGIYNDTGKSAPWTISVTPFEADKRDLWFEADGTNRFFIFWNNEEAAKAAPAKSKKKAVKKPKAVNKASLSERRKLPEGEQAEGDRPGGLNPDLPIVEGAPAGVFGKPSVQNVTGVISGGFFRIVNTSNVAVRCTIEIAFHRAPWHTSFGMSAVGTADAMWFFMPGIKNSAPVTLKILKPTGPGRVDFASQMSDRHVFHSLPFDERGLIVEARRADFLQREDIQTDAEVSGATLAAVKAMRFKGKAPVRFPIGYPSGHDFDYQAGRVLGFNATHGQAAALKKEYFDQLGYRYAFTYTHVLTAAGKGHGYRVDVNDATMRKDAAAWREKGLLDKVYAVSVFDEPGTDVTAPLYGEPDRMADTNAWRQIIRFAGLQPADFIDPTNPPPAGITPDTPEFWKHVRTARVDERTANPRSVLNTMLRHAAIYPSRFGLLRNSIRSYYGTNVFALANVHDSHFVNKLPTDIEPWQIYGRLEALDVPQACDYNIGHALAMEFMIDLFRSAQKPHDKPIDAYQASQSHYLTRPARSLRLRTMSAVGAGARSIQYYNYGPRYLATENWYDDDREKLRAIGEINHAVGWAEELLLDGRPRPSPIAILWPRNGDLWDQLDGMLFYGGERRNMYFLLRGLHHRADFINDQYMPDAAALDHYKVIIMSQRCITAIAAERLLDWVRRGGTLIASVACGQLDDLAQPSHTMLDAFGIAEITPGMETMPDKKNTNAPSRIVEGTTIATRGITTIVKQTDASIMMSLDDKRPAVLERKLGNGRLIYTSFLLGHTYQKGVKMENFASVGPQAAVRDLVAPWLASAGTPDCATDNPAVSARLIEGAAGSAIILVNSTGQDVVDKVRVTISVPRQKPVVVESLAQGILAATADHGKIEFSLPLGLTDVVLIK